MRIVSGISSKEIGELDSEGNVTTTNRDLLALMQDIDRKGFVTPFSQPMQLRSGVRDGVRAVKKGNPTYVAALANVLQRNGFVVVS